MEKKDKKVKLEETEVEGFEENKESKSNGKKVFKYLGVCILVALVCSLFFGLGMLFSNSLEKDNKENSNEVEQDETEKPIEDKANINVPVLTKESEVVKELFNVFREDTFDSLNYDKSKMNTDMNVRLRIAYTLLDESSFKEISCGDLKTAHYSMSDDGFTAFHYCGTGSYEDLSDKALQYWDDRDGVNFDKEMVNAKTNGFAASELEKNYRKLFGQNANYENKTFGIFAWSTTIAYYDSKTDSYAIFTNVGGMEAVMEYDQTLESIEQVDNKLILNTKMNPNEMSVEGKSYNITYTFEYEKETGNYIFVSRVVK